MTSRIGIPALPKSLRIATSPNIGQPEQDVLWGSHVANFFELGEGMDKCDSSYCSSFFSTTYLRPLVGIYMRRDIEHNTGLCKSGANVKGTLFSLA